MLGKLFGSQARVKILKIFLLNPDNKYYIRQLARDLDLQVNSVRRELENLEKFGLLISDISRDDDSIRKEDVARENKEFEELSSGKVISKEIEDKNDVEKSANTKKIATSTGQEKKYYQTNKAFVLYDEIKALMLKSQVLYEKEFAEKLKDIGKPQLLVLTGFFINDLNSNVDILVAGAINKTKFAKLLKELEKEVGRELNYVLMDNKELKNRREMTDVFLFGILEGKRVVVIDELGITG